MAKNFLVSILIVADLFCCLSCNANDEVNEVVSIEGISINNFPVIDGSDSTEPLRFILMCRLLGFDYA